MIQKVSLAKHSSEKDRCLYKYSLLGAVPVRINPTAIAMHPSGRFAYVANLGSNDILAFSIDVATGALTPLTPTVASGDGPTSVSVDSQGRFVYVTNAIEGSISVFAIDAATGALTPASTASAGTNPVALSLDASGRFAYLADLGSDNVTAFTVDTTTGALTPTGTPVNAGTDPVWVTLIR